VTRRGGAEKVYCVGSLTKRRNTVLYTGVTEISAGFTSRYKVFKPVNYEAGYDASGVIAREKQLTSWLSSEKGRAD
jgi:predicted GIY-YIG superfamily endonuclease